MKHHKGFVQIVAISLIALAVIVGAGSYVAFHKKPNVVVTVESPKQIKQENQTEGLKTYKNEKYQYQVQYEGDLNIKEDKYSTLFFRKENSASEIHIPLFYVSVIPHGITGSTKDIYNYLSDGIINKIFSAAINEKIAIGSSLDVSKKISENIRGGEKYVGIETDFGVSEGASKEKFSLVNHNGFTYRIGNYFVGSQTESKHYNFQFTDTPDTTTWKTYKNEEYGFEFEYPGILVPQVLSIESGIISQNSECTIQGAFPDTREIEQNKGTDNFLQSYISFCVFENKNIFGNTALNVDLQAYPNKRYSEDLRSQFQPYTSPSGVQGLVLNTYSWRVIYFKLKSGRVIEITDPAWGSNKQVHIFDQILSTFKFTNTKTGTTDWKTYKNEKYGFEFKYPATFVIEEHFWRNTAWLDYLNVSPIGRKGTNRLIQLKCLQEDETKNIENSQRSYEHLKEIYIDGIKTKIDYGVFPQYESDSPSLQAYLLKKNLNPSKLLWVDSCGLYFVNLDHDNLDIYLKVIESIKFTNGYESFIQGLLKEFEVAMPFKG